ncbi:hypothetical protein [Bradyrhizobium sp. USDA 3256]
MTLEELLSKIEESDASEWNSINRPTFAQDIQQVSGGHPVPWVEIDEHHSLLVLRTDLRISIALGLTHLEDFQEDWATKFADRKASSSWVDFRYNGVPVLRELRVLVDGARAGLPVPQFGKVDIPERQYNIWRLIDAVVGSGNFADYFKRAGLQTVDVYWPEPER